MARRAFRTRVSNRRTWYRDGNLARRRMFLEPLEPRMLLAVDGLIAGATWEDLDGDGLRDSGEPPLSGVVIYLDSNNNGVRDLSAGVEPDQFVHGTSLGAVQPGVTLSVLDNTNAPLPFPVTATFDSFNFAPTGRMVFGHANVQFFGDTRRLKTAFAQPVDRLSLDFAGGNTVLTEFGRLEAYDSAGNLLATYVTQPRAGGVEETMTIVRPAADIAYAIAYTPLAGGSFGRLDNLKFGNTPEPTTATAADGSYSFTGLSAGNHVVREEVPALFRQTSPVVTSDRLFLADVNSNPNRIIEINPATGAQIRTFNAPVNNSTLASGMAFDGNVLYYIEDTGFGDTLFRLNPDTGALLGSRVLPTGPYDGLAVLGGLVYAKQPATNQLLVYNPATDSFLPNLPITGLGTSSLTDGLGEFAAEGTLLARTNLGQLVSINPATGQATTLFSIALTTGTIRGITSIGREIYIGTSVTSTVGVIDVYDRNTLSRVRQITGQPVVFALGGAKGFDGAHRVTLADGQLVQDRDFGNQSILADVRGVKWEDLDGDGLREAGEPPISGVQIYLDLDNDRVQDAGEPAATTAGDGSYGFVDLLPGDYVVREVVPTGYRQTSPQLLTPRMFMLDSSFPAQIKEIDPATGGYRGSMPIPVPFLSSSAGLAFDGQTLYFLSDTFSGDTLFELDPNTGAVLDSTLLPATPSRTYAGLAVLGSAVYLLDSSGDDVLRFDPVTDTVQAVLDLNGLNPGLQINDGLGELKSTGELLAISSDSLVFFNSATGRRSHSFLLPSALSARGVTSIGQDIFVGYSNRIDVFNRAGQLQRSMPGFSSVSALGAAGGDGAYRLTLLPAQDAVKVDFGNQFVPPGEIRGQKWDDADGDRLFDANESPVANAPVYADLNDNGQLDPGEPAAVTDSAGHYLLAGLLPGEYIVRDVVPANYRQTFPAYDVREYFAWSYLIQNSSQMTLTRIDPDTGVVTRVGTPTTFAMHGLVRTSAGLLFGINGTPFQNDGFYSINPATGATTLIGTTGLDLAFGLAYDPVTDAIYGLGVRPNSNFINLVRFNSGTGQATVIGQGVPFNQISATVGLAFDPHRRVIMALDNSDDQFWEFDLDGNARLIWDAAGLDGFGLAHNGRSFVHWPRGVGGNNLLREVDPYTQTFGSTLAAQRFIGMESLDGQLVAGGHRVVLGAGQTLLNLDFGQQFALGTLQGSKWRDNDADGVRDADEPPLAGVVVYLDQNDNGIRDVGDAAEPFTTTAADGSYAFVDIPAGDYVIREEVAFPYRQTFPAEPVDRLFAVTVFEFPSRIYELDPDDGSTIRSFPAPINSQIFNGLAFDGQTLFFLSNDNDVLYEIDPDSGAVLDSTLLPPNSYEGLASLNGLVYARVMAGGPVVVFDPVADAVVGTLAYSGYPAAYIYDGFGEIADPDRLLGKSLFGEILEIHPDTGLVTPTFTIPDSAQAYGLTSIGQEIFVGYTTTPGRINVYSRGGSLLRTLTGTPSVFGLAGRNIGTDYAHRVTLGFNQTIGGLDFGNEKLNEPPVADAGGPYSVEEGSAVGLDASGSSDPDQPAATLIYAWDLDGDGNFGETGAAATRGDEVGVTPTFSAHDLDGPSTITVSLQVTDDKGLSTVVTAEVHVSNVAPEIDSFTSDATFTQPAGPGVSVQILAAFHDAGLSDVHSAVIDWGDGSPPQSATVNQSAGGGAVAASYTYAAGGVYLVTLTVSDDDSGTDVETTVAVVVGVGVHGGELQIIGTNGPDTVSVFLANDSHIQVDASFLAGGSQTFPILGIQRIVALLGGGDDSISIGGSVLIPAKVEGGDGNDAITGGGGPSILLGGTGNDSIIGGRGRNLIIGGIGADRLVGGAGSDLLIAGTTLYDDTDAALLAILLEWTSTREFAARTANISQGLGPVLSGTEIKLLAGETVFDDADVDTLVGASDLDWFLYDLTRDSARDEKPAES
jgi:hypothetical protein